MKVLVIGDVANGQLSSSNWNTVSAAVMMAEGGSVDMCVLGVGDELKPLATTAASIEGVGRVLVVENSRLQHRFAEVEAPLLVKLIDHCAGYDRVVVSATSYGKNLLPRLGALLDVQPLSDITGVESSGIYERPIYAGNAVMRVRQTDRIHLLSIRSTAFVEAGNAASAGSIETLDLEVIDIGDSVVFEGVDFSEHDRPELTTAKVVISGGRGMAAGENFVLLEQVARKLNAAVGASRAAVDAGFVSNDLQVGQTGKVVAPDLYIAVGISGAIQHLAGMKDSKVIVAINSDEEAPIFQVADYGLVADLFSALPELESRLA